MDNNQKPKRSLSGAMGYFVGIVIAACLAALMSSVVLALTVKIITALVMWLY